MNIAAFIDHTNLKPEGGEADIDKLCDEAVRWGFYSVCVNPCRVAGAVGRLDGTGVKVCCVAGFPLGASETPIKVREAELAAVRGALEIDMVINVGALKEGRSELVRSEISAVVKAVPGCLVKVILETALLTDDEKRRGCLLAVEAGAHFVKTSTGFCSGGATVADVRLMRKAVGADLGVKASGGIRDYDAALEMISAGASRLGTSASVAICEDGLKRD